MNAVLREIRKKAKKNNKRYFWISDKDVLSIWKRFGRGEDIIDIDKVYVWIGANTMSIEIFNSVDEFLSGDIDFMKIEGEPTDEILDAITNSLLYILENILTQHESIVMYFLAKNMLEGLNDGVLISEVATSMPGVPIKEIRSSMITLHTKGFVSKDNHSFGINSKYFMKWFEKYYSSVA